MSSGFFKGFNASDIIPFSGKLKTINIFLFRQPLDITARRIHRLGLT